MKKSTGLWWLKEYIICLIIIIKSEVWNIFHCLWLGHETMVCAVCFSIFLQHVLAKTLTDLLKTHGNRASTDMSLTRFWAPKISGFASVLDVNDWCHIIYPIRFSVSSMSSLILPCFFGIQLEFFLIRHKELVAICNWIKLFSMTLLILQNSYLLSQRRTPCSLLAICAFQLWGKLNHCTKDQ